MIAVKCARCAALVDADDTWGLAESGEVLCDECTFVDLWANAMLAKDRRQWRALTYGMMAAALGALLALVTLVRE